MTNKVTSLRLIEVAKHFRVSIGKVKTWIARGELVAINISESAKDRPRYVVTKQAIQAFEQARQTGLQHRRTQRINRKLVTKDYYPDM